MPRSPNAALPKLRAAAPRTTGFSSSRAASTRKDAMPRAASPLKSVRGQQSQRGSRQSKGAASLVDIAGQPLLDLVPEDPPEGSADDDAEPKFDAMDEIQWLRDELAAKAQELSDKDRELAELRARLQSGGSLPQPTCKSILIDMDNTICDFDGEVVRRFTEKFPGQTMLTTSAATRKNWGIAEDVGEPYSEEVKKIFRESGFTESLPPIAGAARALKEMLAEGYDVRLCTSPLVNQPMGVGEKFVWVAAVLGDEWKKRIIITSDKTMVKGLMLIDDKLAIVDEKSICNPPEWKQYAACRLTGHRPFAHKPAPHSLSCSNHPPFTLLFQPPPRKTLCRRRVIFRRPYLDHYEEKLQRQTVLDSWKDWRKVVDPSSAAALQPADGAEESRKDAEVAPWEHAVDETRLASVVASSWQQERPLDGSTGIVLTDSAGYAQGVFDMLLRKQWTLMAWVRPECYALSGDENVRFSLFGCGQSWEERDAASSHHRNAQPSGVSSYFHVETSGPRILIRLGNDILSSDAELLPQEQWSHVAIVYDGVQRRLQLVVNSMLVAQLVPVDPLRSPKVQSLRRLYVGSRGGKLVTSLAGTTWAWMTKAQKAGEAGTQELTLGEDGTTVFKAAKSRWSVRDEAERTMLCEDLGGQRVELRFSEDLQSFVAISLGAEIAKGERNRVAGVHSPRPFKGLVRSVRLIPKSLPSVLVQAVGKVPFIQLVVYSKAEDASTVKILVMSARLPQAHIARPLKCPLGI